MPSKKTADPEFIALKKEVYRKTSLDCEQFKDSYLRRRFAARMRSRGVQQYADYIALLGSDPAEAGELMRDITINVTQFFRDAPVFKALEEEVVPLLIYRKVKEGRPIIKVWSAGCSSGEEPYSVAIILRDLLGEEYDKFSVSIVATDIDRECLMSGQEGIYLPRQLMNVAPEHLRKYFVQEGERHRVVPEIRDMVDFLELDLFSGTAGTNFDLILCRNVAIYFTKEMQERLYMKFVRALGEGGYFVMGNTENLVGDASRMLTTVRTRERIYQKAARERR
ncbi:CheR family methyltransferase [Methanomassiliicoccus luminyensis]|uniref:CheR family methyltransferase n=1 Tax=Methanomassiliicoccus luminyensis TaxID=1080712 RepID=UPI00037D85EE|nr:protein-glutamate O-methyltransferase CheR [Methanomassiliicoccus luminyensis]